MHVCMCAIVQCICVCCHGARGWTRAGHSGGPAQGEWRMHVCMCAIVQCICVCAFPCLHRSRPVKAGIDGCSCSCWSCVWCAPCCSIHGLKCQWAVTVLVATGRKLWMIQDTHAWFITPLAKWQTCPFARCWIETFLQFGPSLRCALKCFAVPADLRMQVLVVDLLSETTDELEFRDRVVKISLGGKVVLCFVGPGSKFKQQLNTLCRA